MGINRRQFHAAVGSLAAGLAGAGTVAGAADRAPTVKNVPQAEQIRAGRPEYWQLVDLINAHRRRNQLPEIALSPQLTVVAYLHAQDLAQRQPQQKFGTLHSWSEDERWTGGAYRADDMTTWRIMWDKPRELTGYPAEGFEICAAQAKDLQQAFQAWINSRLHHDVILNRGVWAEPRWQWQAVGAVYYQGYACGWFGNRRDA